MKILVYLFFLISIRCYGQFCSSDSYDFSKDIPKASNIGDTVHVSTNFFIAYNDYILHEVDNSGRYIYRPLKKSNLSVKITYDKADKVESYTVKYNEFGGKDHAFFMIHYYQNGNVKDHIYISFYQINQPNDMIIYDSLNYIEKNRANIPSKKYYTYFKSQKVYLSERNLGKSELKKLIRKVDHLRDVKLIENFPYKIYLL